MNQLHTTDVAIIGAGPVGLFAAFELGMLKLSCTVIDALDFTGGQCTALYPEKPIYDIAGYPQIEAAQLIKNLEEQAAPFSPTYLLGQRVEKIEPSSADTTHHSPLTTHRFLLTTSTGATIECGAILIAAGCGAFGPNRPPLPGIEKYEGSAVHYMVGRKEDFRGKTLVIAGGGDSAVDWVLSLADIARKIYVVHRRDKFRAIPDNIEKMLALAQTDKVEMVIPYQLERLEGDGKILSAVIVKDFSNNERRLEADILLPFYGLAMELGPIATWGLNLEKNHIAVNPATCQTNHTGIYAIGDINTYPGKLKLIACGFSEAAMAAHSIRAHLKPDEVFHFEYSTTKGVPA